VDKTGVLTRITAEAQAALDVGETERARALFGEAGSKLEEAVTNRRKASEKHLYRFLAASQYYHGGHYRKAQALCRQIEARLLPDQVRPLYPSFLRDVKERAAEQYTATVQRSLMTHWHKREYQRILETLQAHPYVLDQGDLAFVRGECCEQLGDYHAAALFFADALRMKPDDAELASLSASCALTLVSKGRLSEASEYIQHQLRLMPHAATLVSASLLRYHEACKAATAADRRHFFEEQLRYFEQARVRYQDLQPAQRNATTLRDFMRLCFEAAALALLRLGDKERAREVSDGAIDLFPSAPGPRTVRGFVTYPEGAAVRDFEDAVGLGERHYPPYYFLAHAALTRGNFAETESWCWRALEARPSPPVEAQLTEWMAIVASQRGAPAEDVRKLFDRAESLDPGNPRIRQNRQVFEAAAATAARPHPDAWNRTPADESVEDYLGYEEERLAAANGQAAWTERQLAVMAG
jgi:tetratricopeptide (TPR) repeat protein